VPPVPGAEENALECTDDRRTGRRCGAALVEYHGGSAVWAAGILGLGGGTRPAGIRLGHRNVRRGGALGLIVAAARRGRGRRMLRPARRGDRLRVHTGARLQTAGRRDGAVRLARGHVLEGPEPSSSLFFRRDQVRADETSAGPAGGWPLGERGRRSSVEDTLPYRGSACCMAIGRVRTREPGRSRGAGRAPCLSMGRRWSGRNGCSAEGGTLQPGGRNLHLGLKLHGRRRSRASGDRKRNAMKTSAIFTHRRNVQAARRQ